MARRADALAEIEGAIASSGGKAASFAADATDPASIAAAFASVRELLGDPEVLVYNAGAFVMGGVLDVTPAQLLDACFRANCSGAFAAAREVVPAMLARGRGTLLLTGATAGLRGSAGFSALAAGKFGRARSGNPSRASSARRASTSPTSSSTARFDTPRVRAHSPGRPAHTLLDPEAIADVYWHLHRQSPTTWTQEMDLRPAGEKF